MSCMYELRPAFELPVQLSLPTNMYDLSPVNGSSLLSAIQDKSEQGKSGGDLGKRWDLVLQQLQDLKLQLAEIRKAVENDSPQPGANGSKPASQSLSLATSTANLQDINECVINADPSRPPLSLLLLRRLLTDVSIVLSAHTHSTTADVAPALTQLFSQQPSLPTRPTIRIFVIWRKGLLDPELVLSRVRNAVIVGEVNILRYLSRLGVPLGYSNDDSSLAKDEVLDTCHTLTHTSALKERQAILKQLDKNLGSAAYLGGSQVDICDVAGWAAIRGGGPALSKNLPPKLLTWYNCMSAIIE